MKAIRELRKKANLTQKELAEKVNVSNVALSNWEKGVHEPTYENLQALAKALNVSEEYLFEERKKVGEARYRVSRDKAAYALILEENPNIDPDGSIAKLVYKHGFQVLILSLLELLSNADEKQDDMIDLISKLINEMNKMKAAEFSIRQIEDFMDAISFILAATSSSHEEAKGAAIRMLTSYIDEYKKP